MVKLCEEKESCPLWIWRFGKSNKKVNLSEAERKKRATRIKGAVSKKKRPLKGGL